MNTEQLIAIFSRTSGRCHLCHGKLALRNYGVPAARGAWHVEHSKPRARGGTNHGNNLLPAHVGCNLRKGTQSTRSIRQANGKKRKPMSFERRERVREKNQFVGATAGAAIGLLVGGPIGAFLGTFVGAVYGSEVRPTDE